MLAAVATVGEKIQHVRLNLRPKLSQERLAGKIGRVEGKPLTRDMVANYESDRSEPPVDFVKRMARHYGVAEGWFWNGGSLEPIPLTTPDYEEPPNIRTPRPDELAPIDQRLTDGQWIALPVWRGVIAGEDDECSFVESDSPRVPGGPHVDDRWASGALRYLRRQWDEHVP